MAPTRKEYKNLSERMACEAEASGRSWSSRCESEWHGEEGRRAAEEETRVAAKRVALHIYPSGHRRRRLPSSLTLRFLRVPGDLAAERTCHLGNPRRTHSAASKTLCRGAVSGSAIRPLSPSGELRLR